MTIKILHLVQPVWNDYWNYIPSSHHCLVNTRIGQLEDVALTEAEGYRTQKLTFADHVTYLVAHDYSYPGCSKESEREAESEVRQFVEHIGNQRRKSI
jgi:hypothetical protein